jgi:pyridoxal phosphate enzyme (YggS family)
MGTESTASDLLRDNYHRLLERIAQAAERGGRSGSDVVLVAVTKYAQPEMIQQLVQMGQRDLGESRPQQLIERVSQVESPADQPVRWHMVGHLQRNKVKPILPHVRLIHSVDSMRLAEEIHTQAGKRDLYPEALLQVNVSGEQSKFGIPLAAAMHLAEQIQTMMHLRLRGLMTMAPKTEDAGETRRCFAQCRELFEEIRAAGAGLAGERFNILSMGMSGDFEIAIEEGANLVRVGSALFEGLIESG